MCGIWSFYLLGREDRTQGPKEGMGHCGCETSFLLADAGAGESVGAQCKALNRKMGKEPRKAHGRRGKAGTTGLIPHPPLSSLDKMCWLFYK